MIEFMQNFHFLRPEFLLFLLVPLLFYFIKLKNIAYFSSWENVCDENLLSFLLINGKTTKKTSVLKYIYVGLTAAAFACAGPAWKKIELPAFTVENPNMFIISLAQDMQLKDVTPSRLERAKFMLSDIADNITQGQFGIEVYSQEPYTVTPFTDDISLIKNLLPQIVPDIVPDQGDRLDRAISLAFERFQTAGYASGNIILFASDVGQRFDLALEKTKEAVSKNYTINVVDTSYDGNEKLQLLAEAGNGVYTNVQTMNPSVLYNQINNINQERILQTDNSRPKYADYGYYILFIPLICLLPFFRKGLMVLILCFTFSGQAFAGFWLNDEQEGAAYFKKEQYDQALGKFKNPDWRGAALYKQNKLEDALKEFEKSDSAIAVYNRGVIAAKLCNYSEAQNYFNEALKKDPQNTDALYNLQVLAELFEKAQNDPSVLECQDKQDRNQNQNNNNQNEENSEKDQDQQQQNNTANDENNRQNNEENASQNSDSNQENEENSDENPNSQSENNPQNSADDTSQSPQQSQTDTSNNDDGKTEENHNQENQSNSSTDEKTHENNKPSDNSQRPDEQSQSDFQPEDDKQNNQEAQIAEARENGQNEDYDEEALAIQRRYREIPEDTGGLLREFIKKEYLKGRYRNEAL